MHGQLWRVVTSFLVFQNSAQIIVGLILLYTCRQFERQMGSKKFGAFLVFSVFVSTLIGLAIIVAAWSVGFYLVPSPGPFPLIFALMTYYFCKYLYFHIVLLYTVLTDPRGSCAGHIPKLHATQYSFAGLDLSEKSWIYLLAMQLMVSDGVPSIAAASTGLLAGYLYETDGFGLQSWRLPGFIEVGSIFQLVSVLKS
jgi:membrane associated rhomboid family serine protease